MNIIATKIADSSPHYRSEVGTQAVPPGYQRTELGVIPEDWAYELLGNLFEFKNGREKYLYPITSSVSEHR